MSVSKKFYELQDLILAKTSLEKVKLHIQERKDKTIYKWVKSELNVFIRKFYKVEKFKNIIDNINKGIDQEKYDLILDSVIEALDKISNEIEKYYNDLQQMS
ncbi:hypothetical protein BFU36_10105 [Sulfolobus sp. A20]|uniref:hypothetical protein n=1 Tax=Saccharolobus sp. A20 TaxID=1891280 RepID=UPI000845D35E|nr:hypothetical protein [Sulfolobus sp. A20]TRM77904.1 hypothetical protein DJ528_05815 [Sulfolobus sp. B5]TRM77944.1 hypothetical protein DJ532_02570 [Sulfolobus sp. A20-N-F8]TRM80567.1 hypothetical protein DJ524_07190 [Sulfolobus sp. D5]TRM83424.1 hypothetical protein DJ531_05460 [Sulfolobus sp. A20-N-F6]TRM87941.1 hypothetical protein DJ529_06790 [Sulfolobus sp. C3]TRM88815.1 hypothetical protein DJ521_01180 [Sulfolobus sp. E3]TRN02250.1 hypothetical protein DJ527_04180 [Sulfolobus sp. F1